MMFVIEAVSASSDEVASKAANQAVEHVSGQIKTLEAAMMRLTAGSTATGSPPKIQKKSSRDKGGKRNGPTPKNYAEALEAVFLRASVWQSCEGHCGCQCHTVSPMQTPAWLRSALGSCMVRYNSIPLFDKRPCNFAGCRASSRKSFSLRLECPCWLLKRTIQVATSWNACSGTDVALFVGVPRAADFCFFVTALHNRTISAPNLNMQNFLFWMRP